MEYNFLLLEDNKLSIQKNETFLQLNQENLVSHDQLENQGSKAI